MDVRLSEAPPHWAEGCEECRYGIALAPEPSKTLPLYIARAALMENTVYCHCKAGVMYEAWSKRKREEQGSTDAGNHRGVAGTAGRDGVGAIPIQAWESWTHVGIAGDAESE
jgi:hypothetical protein